MGRVSKGKVVGILLMLAWITGVVIVMAPLNSRKYEIEVVSQGRTSYGAKFVVLRFTNHTSKLLEFSESSGQIGSVTYHPAGFDPSVDPIRGRTIAFCGALVMNSITLPAHSSIEVPDNFGQRPSGQELVACWQPPVGWGNLYSFTKPTGFRSLRYKLSSFIQGPPKLGPLPPKAPTGWREKLAHSIRPKPPAPVCSEPFEVE